MRPHIGAVTGDKDGCVADEFDVERAGLGANLPPLAEEKVLEERVGLGAVGDGFGQRGGFGLREETDLGGPFPPRLALEVIFEREKQRVGLQPGAAFGLEAGEIAVGQTGAATGFEVLEGTEKNGPFGDVEPTEVDLVLRKLAQSGQIEVGKESGAHERLEIDQIRVAGKRRETLVG